MSHQLYVLQVLTFNLLEDRMMTKMDPQDQVSARRMAIRPRDGEGVFFKVFFLHYSEARSF